MAKPKGSESPDRVRQAFRLWRETFAPYQYELLSEESAIALWVKARQIGFSHSIAGDAVKNALLEGSTNIILSASQELASEVLEKAKLHAVVLRRLGLERMATTPVSNATRICFPNGGRVIALPASKRTARSFTGHVYFDEFAYHDDPKGIWDAAAAMSTRKAGDGQRRKIRVISTPNGAQGLFYRWSTNPPKGWARHAVDIDRAILEGMPVDIDHLWELAGHDERIFAQWYRLAFLDAALQYIPTAMADRALGWVGEMPDLQQCEIHAGLDVGRESDLTALTLVALYGRYAYVLPPITCRRTAFRQQRRMVADARDIFRWSTLHIDSTGIGAGIAEEFVDAWGEEEVRLVPFTNPAKDDLATRALRWFRDDRVRLPHGKPGEQLHAEIISVRREITQAGNVVYNVPRDAQGHGDRWWSMCLGLKGAGEPLAPRGMGEEPLLAVA